MIDFKRSVNSKRYNDLYGRAFKGSRHKFKVVWCSDLRYEGQQVRGLCVPDHKAIYILTENNDIQGTLIHEMMHAELFSVGMYCMPSWSIDFEELICEAASRIVSQFKIKREK